jgi:16S rRNA (uracil1498-N3)-methyltransferase
LQRYFIEKNPDDGNSIQISGEDYHHIVRVMRMTVGSRLIAVFPSGKAALCEIVEIANDYVEVNTIEWETTNRELPVRVAIASALLKGDKYDMVIQKGTELGAHQFISFASERSVVKLDEKKGIKKVERWSKIAKEAAEQSERNVIPNVSPPLSLQKLIEVAKSYTQVFVAYEESGRSFETSELYVSLKKLKEFDSILFLFGPEGGFSPKEIEQFKQHHFTFCGLGPRILRAETAPLYSLSAISFYFELQR